MSQNEKRIFIIEDSIDIQSLLSVLLESSGYKVEYASNGKEALTHLKNAEKLPHLILLDLLMPEMNGYEFRKAQKEESKFAHIPVILMTAGGSAQLKSEKVEVDALLMKPFTDIPTILKTIEKFFV